ncbi:hypothetical protein DSECCO2_578190 [anaerobic digester metagenome]
MVAYSFDLRQQTFQCVYGENYCSSRRIEWFGRDNLHSLLWLANPFDSSIGGLIFPYEHSLFSTMGNRL